MYLTLIHPYLSYKINICDNVRESILQQQKFNQQFGLRIMNRSFYDSYTNSLFKIASILKINYLLKHKAPLFIGRLPQSFIDSSK